MPTTTATDDVRDGARLIARLIEPLTGQVYFAPECHERYQALGFNGSPFSTGDGVALPDGPAYFTSRGSALGQAPGELVAAAFGVFNAEAVVPAVTFGWTLTDAADHRDCRIENASSFLFAARKAATFPVGTARHDHGCAPAFEGPGDVRAIDEVQPQLDQVGARRRVAVPPKVLHRRTRSSDAQEWLGHRLGRSQSSRSKRKSLLSKG